MGLIFRKSIKIAPGIKLNVGKSSVGLSAGVKGARVSANSNGQSNMSVGAPGTGLRYQKRLNSKSAQQTKPAAYSFCNQCGTKLHKGSNFCHKCGNQI